MIPSTLLDILCCPENHQPLQSADNNLLSRINASIASGSMKNRAGQPVLTPISDGLLRQDGKWLYPIQGGIPILLVDEALPVP